MENKLNLVELLKDCPKGTLLYATVHGEVKLSRITSSENYPIEVELDSGADLFTEDGRMYPNKGECVLFPTKDQRDWSKFQRPFKDGDIIFTHADSLKIGLGNTWISIFKENSAKGVVTYAGIKEDGSSYYDNTDEEKGLLCSHNDIVSQRLATEEEKQKLFQAIKDNGYKWNEEIKTLEELIQPKFKIGDRIVHKVNKESPFTITEITNDYYKGGTQYENLIEQQDNFELVPNKFDITTLKPFDKVLVRDGAGFWRPSLFGKDMIVGYRYFTACGNYKECIPYENNEHLLGTRNDCDDFYKTWE